MDPKKNRRWVMAALAAAAVVFLVMAGGEVPTAGPEATPTTANAVLASGTGSSPDTGGSSGPGASSGGSASADHNGASAGHDSASSDTGVSSGRAADDGAANDSAANDSAGAVERSAVLDFLRQLLDALGISPEELVGSADSANNNSNGKADNNTDNAAGAGSGAARDNGVQVEEPAAPAATASITIANFAFGQPVTVAPGATVEVQNTDTAPHNVTADDGSFATDNIAQNETTTFVAPTRPGRYAYSCTLHPEMTGTLIVQAEAGTGTGAGGDAPTGAGGGTARSNGSSGSTPQDTQTGGSATRAPQGGATGNAQPSPAPSTGSGYGSGDGY